MMPWKMSAASVLLAAGSAAAGAQSPPPDLGIRVDTAQAVNACLTPEQQRQPLEQISVAQRRRILGCVNAATARQINAQLPKQVDELTQLDRITTSGVLLTYHYSVARRLAELPSGIVPALERATRANVCAQQNMQRTMEMGGIYGYRWVDADGRQIHQMTITSC